MALGKDDQIQDPPKGIPALPPNRKNDKLVDLLARFLSEIIPPEDEISPEWKIRATGSTPYFFVVFVVPHPFFDLFFLFLLVHSPVVSFHHHELIVYLNSLCLWLLFSPSLLIFIVSHPLIVVVSKLYYSSIVVRRSSSCNFFYR